MSDNHDLLNDNDMCSFSGHEAEDMCFNCGDHTCGNNHITSEEKPKPDTHVKFSLDMEIITKSRMQKEM